MYFQRLNYSLVSIYRDKIINCCISCPKLGPENAINKYLILMLTWITQNLRQYFKKCILRTYHVIKIGTRLQMCKGTDIENTKWGRHRGWMKWEIGIDIYTLLCIKDASLVGQW